MLCRNFSLTYLLELTIFIAFQYAALKDLCIVAGRQVNEFQDGKPGSLI